MGRGWKRALKMMRKSEMRREDLYSLRQGRISIWLSIREVETGLRDWKWWGINSSGVDKYYECSIQKRSICRSILLMKRCLINHRRENCICVVGESLRLENVVSCRFSCHFVVAYEAHRWTSWMDVIQFKFKFIFIFNGLRLYSICIDIPYESLSLKRFIVKH